MDKTHRQCPFCPAGAEVILSNHVACDWINNGWAVCCDTCGAVGPVRQTAEEAEAAWEIRPIETVEAKDVAYSIAHTASVEVVRMTNEMQKNNDAQSQHKGRLAALKFMLNEVHGFGRSAAKAGNNPYADCYAELEDDIRKWIEEENNNG